MALGLVTIAHAVIAVFLIIELGLMAYLVDVTSTPYYSSPATYSFMLFNCVWSILVLIYLALIPMFFSRFFHSMAALALMVVTTIFWFAGAIALAAFIGVPHCRSTFCHSAQAAVAFGFFIWALFMALTVIEGLAFMRSRGHGAHADTTKPGQSYA